MREACNTSYLGKGRLLVNENCLQYLLRYSKDSLINGGFWDDTNLPATDRGAENAYDRNSDCRYDHAGSTDCVLSLRWPMVFRFVSTTNDLDGQFLGSIPDLVARYSQYSRMVAFIGWLHRLVVNNHISGSDNVARS